MEALHDPKLLLMACWFAHYPFADDSIPALWTQFAHAQALGRAVILSDGDAVFQPLKIARSGCARTVRRIAC